MKKCFLVFIGLLVGLGGYAIGYDIYEGNTYEGNTLIPFLSFPFLEKISQKFNLDKSVVIADSGLLSKNNIEALDENGYEYILGARVKNEGKAIKSQILSAEFSDGTTHSFTKNETPKLIVNYSNLRARKDEYNRNRGFKRLEKRIKSGQLTKSNINNREYNKYLKLEGEVTIDIDYDKFKKDAVWAKGLYHQY